MLPHSYQCSSCREEFRHTFHTPLYYMGAVPATKKVSDQELFRIPVRPAWCKDCSILSLAEDIASLRVFEGTYGAVRCGRNVDYPIETEYLDPSDAEKEVAEFLRWRMGRRHAARALCCGGLNYQFMDVAQPLLKHAACDFGIIEPLHHHIGGYVARPLGMYEPANICVYTPEGELFGLLTWYSRDKNEWEIGFTNDPSVVED